MSDQLGVRFLGGGVQSFFETCVDVFCGTSLLKYAASSAQLLYLQLITLLKDLGVTYKGKCIDKGM